MERRSSLVEYLSYLRGGPRPIMLPSDLERVKTLVYVASNPPYHRENVVSEIVSLFKESRNERIREALWVLITKIPLPHLLYLHKYRVPKSLRLAVVTKIANSSREEILRTFLIYPNRYRKLFTKLRLPTKMIKGREITNENYRFAASLLNKSMRDVIDEIGIDTVARLAPIHSLLNVISNPSEALVAAEQADPQSYLEHYRWFSTILGEDKASEIALSKIEKLSDPLKFVHILNHLKETGVNDKVINTLEKKIDTYIDSLLKKHGIKHVILVVDVSSSMYEAVEVTKKLYPTLKRISNVDIVAFNTTAWRVPPEELDTLSPGGMTSIGAGIVEASKLVREDTSAVVLITDCQENTRPMVEDVVHLLNGKPLVIVRVGDYTDLRTSYPKVYVDVKGIHKRLVGTVIDAIVRAVSRREEASVMIDYNMLAEEIMKQSLPVRDPSTKRPGYIVRLLGGD